MPLSQVRDLLGHASIVTTERYDNHQLERLQVAPGKLESGKLFHPPTLGSGTEFHISFHNRPTGGTVEPVTTIDDVRKLLQKQPVKDWLGGRDSSPLEASGRRASARLKTCRPANRTSRR